MENSATGVATPPRDTRDGATGTPESPPTSIVDALPLGIVVVDAEGRCARENAAARTLLGLPNGTSAQKQLGALVEDATVRASLEEIVASARRGVPVTRDIRLANRTVDVRSVPGAARPGQVVLCVEDVTWRRAFDGVRERFFSMISHELRTPLTVIRGYLDIFERGLAGEMTDQQRDGTVVMTEQCAKLESLIRKLVDFRDAEPESSGARAEAVAVAPLLRQVARNNEPAANAAGLSIRIDTDDQLWCWCAQSQLRDIIRHLIENAARFASGGSTVQLVASALDRALLPPLERRAIARNPSPDAHWIHLRICDDGPGIPSDPLAELSRPTPSTTGDAGGRSPARAGTIGLGLAVVARIVDLAGGTLWIDSQPTRGTSVSVVLPQFIPRAD